MPFQERELPVFSPVEGDVQSEETKKKKGIGWGKGERKDKGKIICGPFWERN